MKYGNSLRSFDKALKGEYRRDFGRMLIGKNVIYRSVVSVEATMFILLDSEKVVC